MSNNNDPIDVIPDWENESVVIHFKRNKRQIKELFVELSLNQMALLYNKIDILLQTHARDKIKKRFDPKP
jgi:hypothetical protein